jgi:hypothetical protein
MLSEVSPWEKKTSHVSNILRSVPPTGLEFITLTESSVQSCVRQERKSPECVVDFKYILAVKVVNVVDYLRIPPPNFQVKSQSQAS